MRIAFSITIHQLTSLNAFKILVSKGRNTQPMESVNGNLVQRHRSMLMALMVLVLIALNIKEDRKMVNVVVTFVQTNKS